MPDSPDNVIQSNAGPKNTTAKDTVNVLGIPAVSVQGGKLQVGDARSSSHRSYTPIKTLGDGSFGTVLLCDWHGTLPPNTPLSPMQCGGGARPEWAGKHLVAVKRIKKKWEGSWDECKRLKELESLRAIPFHPCIIPLYDFFLLPDTKELYLVFESMEGNLYHLIKARKGRPLAGGLVASIFRQIVSGLHHIHASGYFHRDMKPENVLVTTTGLFEYRSLSPVAPPTAPPEKDIIAIIKLAGFGLARETASPPPYTEYISTRWYRAPEVLLRSRDYSNPVDMWALGAIMAELVNLRPLFPGSGQIDQIHCICEVLGDPADYGSDTRGRAVGGGKWSKGLEMAKQSNFTFPKCQPKDTISIFDRSVPRRLVECISDLLKYDPDARLTSRQCLEHPYFVEALPYNMPPVPPSGSRSVSPSHSHNSLPKSPYHPTSSNEEAPKSGDDDDNLLDVEIPASAPAPAPVFDYGEPPSPTTSVHPHVETVNSLEATRPVSQPVPPVPTTTSPFEPRPEEHPDVIDSPKGELIIWKWFKKIRKGAGDRAVRRSADPNLSFGPSPGPAHATSTRRNRLHHHLHSTLASARCPQMLVARPGEGSGPCMASTDEESQPTPPDPFQGEYGLLMHYVRAANAERARKQADSAPLPRKDLVRSASGVVSQGCVEGIKALHQNQESTTRRSGRVTFNLKFSVPEWMVCYQCGSVDEAP